MATSLATIARRVRGHGRPGKPLSELILETGQQMQTFKSAASENVIPQQRLVLEPGSLMQPQDARVALRNMGYHLVHAEVIEAVVEHQQLCIFREASPS